MSMTWDDYEKFLAEVGVTTPPVAGGLIGAVRPVITERPAEPERNPYAPLCVRFQHKQLRPKIDDESPPLGSFPGDYNVTI